MWKGPLRLVDAFSSRLLSPRFLQGLAAWADNLAAKNRLVYDIILYAYAFAGPLLVFAFFAFLMCLPGILCAVVVYSSLFLLDAGAAQDILRSGLSPEIMFVDFKVQLLKLALIVPPAILVVVLITFLNICRTRAPGGLLLLPSEAPQLFSTAQAVAAKLDTRIDRILLTNQFNCAVIAMPKFVGEEHVLYVGLPVLSCMSVSQLEAILAHEAGHLAGKHSQSRRISEQLRAVWFARMQSWRQKRPYFYIPFNIIFFWYTPIFGLLSLAKAKHQEFDADSAAQKVTDTGIYGKSLLSFTIKLNLFSKAFGKLLEEKLPDTTYGEAGIFARAADLVKNFDLKEIDDCWNSYRARSDEELTNSHPCLMKRLQKLHILPTDLATWEPDWNDILDKEGTSALTLLGSFAARAEEKMSSAFGDAKLSHDVSRENAHLVRANAHYRAHRYDEALADVNEAIKLAPYLPEAYITRSSVYIEMKQLEKALDDCNHAMALKPGNAGAFSNRACVYLLMSNWEKASADATTAITLDWRKTAAYSFRATAYIMLEKFDEALSDLHISLERQPNQVNGLLQRAAIYARKKNLPPALNDLSDCLQLQPNNWDALSMRVGVYFDLDRDEEAFADLNRLLALSPDCADTLIARAFILCQRGKEEAARADFEQSLPRPIKDPASRMTRCYVACVLKDWTQGLKDAEEAYKVGMRQPVFLSNYARVLHELGRNQEALPLIEAVLEKGENQPRVIAVRARVMHGLGRNEEALSAINAAIEKVGVDVGKKSEPQFYGVRAKVYRALGRDQEADADEALACVAKAEPGTASGEVEPDTPAPKE